MIWAYSGTWAAEGAALDDREASSVTLLLVCTANLCRSPTAQVYLQAAAERRSLPWRVRSAGLQARDGLVPPPPVQELVARRGHDLTGWSSSRLTDEMISEADLILTATREQRSAVARRQLSAVGRTLTLLQLREYIVLSRRARGHQPSRLPPGERLVQQVRAGRNEAQPHGGVEHDIADPMGGRMGAYRTCDGLIHAAVNDIVDNLW